jgi:hypothetical protein
MSMFISAETGGFYHPSIHATMPSDVVEISDDEYRALLDAQSNGLEIIQAPGQKPSVRKRELTSDGMLITLRGILSSSEAAGIVFKGHRFATTPDAIARYAGAWTDGRYLLAMDGTPVALTSIDVAQIHDAAQAHLAACVARYAELHAAVTADPATDVTTGWPE